MSERDKKSADEAADEKDKKTGNASGDVEKGDSGSEKNESHLPEKSSPKYPAKPNNALREHSRFSLAVTQKRWHKVCEGLRDELWEKSIARKLIFSTVLVPAVFIFCYLMFWASSAYISEAKFAVRGQSTTSSQEGLSILFSLPSSTQNDSYIVLNYIMSLDMFTKLDKKLHLREHYSDEKHDIWFRLSKKATNDETLDFWEWACEASYDPDTSILEVKVKAFSPEMALEICEEILRGSEELVNEMNVRSRQDAIYKARLEVERSEERIRQARSAMQKYRDSTVILDPNAVASGLYEVVNRLEAEITQTTAELSEAMGFMHKDSPRVRQLEMRLRVLQEQLSVEKSRLAGKMQGDQSLSKVISTFQNLALEEEFAQKQLTSAMASLEAAKVQADAQSEYVEAFSRPRLADESLYPRPVLFTMLYMITALLVLGLISLIIAAVREHAGF